MPPQWARITDGDLGVTTEDESDITSTRREDVKRARM